MFASALKSTVIVSVVAFLAIASAVPTSSSQCDNGGAMQCCKTVMNSTSDDAESLGGLLGLLGLGHVLGDIALNCSPIDVLGVVGGTNCAEQAVCCSNVVQNGLINVGCTPINLAL